MGSNVSATFRNIRSFRANIWWALGFRGLSDWNWGSFRYCWTWMWNLKTCTLASACGNVVRWAGSGRFMKSFPVLRKNAREIGRLAKFDVLAGAITSDMCVFQISTAVEVCVLLVVWGRWKQPGANSRTWHVWAMSLRLTPRLMVAGVGTCDCTAIYKAHCCMWLRPPWSDMEMRDKWLFLAHHRSGQRSAWQIVRSQRRLASVEPAEDSACSCRRGCRGRS